MTVSKYLATIAIIKDVLHKTSSDTQILFFIAVVFCKNIAIATLDTHHEYNCY